MVRTVAVHHVAPQHAEEFLAYMRRVQRAVDGAPGLIEIASYREDDGRLVAIATWASLESFHAALPRIRGLSHERRPEWTVRDDDVLVLQPA